MQKVYDLAIIGGGINGCGIARDAAGRGHSVYLCEQNDLASGTSSWSTKLIHGGLRYLEHYEFRLVHEALVEREVLLNLAPHIIWPLRFVLPHHKGLRPAWLLRLGLLFYDYMGGRKVLPPTRVLDLRQDEAGAPLKPGFSRAFEYSDCWVQDSRLVVLNAMDARAHGAVIETNTRLIAAKREEGQWRLEVADARGRRFIMARTLVNAAGPWVDDVLNTRIGARATAHVRLVQGSHIVVRRLFEHERCYIFQNDDGRIIFAIPYENDFTLIGTTDLDYVGDPGKVAISSEETRYLCSAASDYFARPIHEADIVWSYSGVRPLFDDGASKAQEATRDYVLRLDGAPGAPAVLSVFGGKITTYRKLAEAVLEKLGSYLGTATSKQAGWTAKTALPGGDFPVDGFEALLTRLTNAYPRLPRGLIRRLARNYGTRSFALLRDAQDMAALGEVFGADLTAREVDYLMDAEWAQAPADILWRRSKLGLRVEAAEAARLAAYMQRNSTRQSMPGDAA